MCWLQDVPRVEKSHSLTHQYHVTSGDVHVGLRRLFAPGGSGAVGGGGAVLRPVAELRGHAAHSRRVGAPPTAGATAWHDRARHAASSHAVLAAQA